MLQVIAGKFFKGGRILSQECRGVFYSNLSIPFAVETSIAKIEPAHALGDISTYVVTFTNKGEAADPPRPGVLVMGTDSQVLDQVEPLLCFGFQAWFGNERAHVDHQCRAKPIGPIDKCIPAWFLPHLKRGRAATPKDIEGFQRLTEKLIALPRKKFEAAMTALETLRGACEAVNHSVDLAYSMLIYCLESLTQGFDEYKPAWSDYEEDVRQPLDQEFSKLEADAAARIRDVLLSASHLKLSKRFREFVSKHVLPAYFLEEASTVKLALRPSEVERALRNAYQLRSGFVHNLIPIRAQLHVPQLADMDVFRWEHEPYPTLAGLFRLTRHVISSFIQRAPSIDKEDLNWRDMVPGVVSLKLASEYWIHQAKGLAPDSAVMWLGGVLDHLREVTAGEAKAITNLREVVKRCAELAPGCSGAARRALVCIPLLWQSLVSEENRLAEAEKLIEEYASDVCAAPNIEVLATLTFLGGRPRWSTDESMAVYEKWRRERHRPRALEIPLALELAIVVDLSRRAASEGKPELRSALLTDALREAAGHPAWQEAIRRAIEKGIEVQTAVLLPHVVAAKNAQPGTTSAGSGDTPPPAAPAGGA